MKHCHWSWVCGQICSIHSSSGGESSVLELVLKIASGVDLSCFCREAAAPLGCWLLRLVGYIRILLLRIFEELVWLVRSMLWYLLFNLLHYVFFLQSPAVGLRDACSAFLTRPPLLFLVCTISQLSSDPPHCEKKSRTESITTDQTHYVDNKGQKKLTPHLKHCYHSILREAWLEQFNLISDNTGRRRHNTFSLHWTKACHAFYCTTVDKLVSARVSGAAIHFFWRAPPKKKNSARVSGAANANER